MKGGFEHRITNFSRCVQKRKKKKKKMKFNRNSLEKFILSKRLLAIVVHNNSFLLLWVTILLLECALSCGMELKYSGGKKEEKKLGSIIWIFSTQPSYLLIYPPTIKACKKTQSMDKVPAKRLTWGGNGNGERKKSHTIFLMCLPLNMDAVYLIRFSIFGLIVLFSYIFLRSQPSIAYEVTE